MAENTNMQRAQNLMAQMLNLHLFVAVRKFKTQDGVTSILLDHLNWVIELEEKGIVFAAGPILDEDQKPTVGGMLIIRAENLSEARRSVFEDPFAKADLIDIEVFEWRLAEGSMKIDVSLSKTSLSIS